MSLNNRRLVCRRIYNDKTYFVNSFSKHLSNKLEQCKVVVLNRRSRRRIESLVLCKLEAEKELTIINRAIFTFDYLGFDLIVEINAVIPIHSINEPLIWA